MKRRTFLAGAAASLAPPALAQTQWPLGQPIRIIVPFPAAGVPKHVALLKKASFEAQ
jgi:tripartite-type tricarboxylate transporter receptor subunit TctC